MGSLVSSVSGVGVSSNEEYSAKRSFFWIDQGSVGTMYRDYRLVWNVEGLSRELYWAATVLRAMHVWPLSSQSELCYVGDTTIPI